MIQTISDITRNKKMTEGNIYNNEDLFQIKDFMLVQRVIEKINSILNLNELMEQIIKDASRTLGFTKCGVLLYDEDNNQLQLAAVTGWEDKVHKLGDRFDLGVGIVWKAFVAKKTIYYPDINEYPEEIHCDFTSQSHIDIPLISKGGVIGILNAQHSDKDGFSRHDIRILKTLAVHLSIAIQNAKLFEEEKREKEIILRDLMEASVIQKKLFPTSSPEIINFRITGMCEPCHEVGGDWYDYIELSSGKLGVVLADVAGKGLAAALLMTSARTIMRMIAREEESPARLLNKVNDILIDDLPSSRFITMIYAVIDPENKTVTLANAGHHSPVICSIDIAEYLQAEAGLPLGISKFSYNEFTFKLNEGEKLFLYSDGVPEAMNARRELFGEDRLIRNLKKSDANLNSLFADVKAFTGNISLSDDLTIVMIETT
jgi:phosphoserine phosphatase RsbU/P